MSRIAVRICKLFCAEEGCRAEVGLSDNRACADCLLGRIGRVGSEERMLYDLLKGWIS